MALNVLQKSDGIITDGPRRCIRPERFATDEEYLKAKITSHRKYGWTVVRTMDGVVATKRRSNDEPYDCIRIFWID